MQREIEINHYKKERVFEYYTRIVKKFKNYEKVTKKQMLKEIYKEYEDYHHIIDLCSVKELKYLEMTLKNGGIVKDLPKKAGEIFNRPDPKYTWERMQLSQKFLIDYDFKKNETYIPDSLLKNVELAVKNTNWKEHKKIDELNEIIIGFCKTQGTALIPAVVNIGAALTRTSEELVADHIAQNRFFKFHVYIVDKFIKEWERYASIAIHEDFYSINELISEERKKQALAGTINTDTEFYKTIFYHDFDINNPKIKRFLDEFKKLPFLWSQAIDIIREYSMLNIDRAPLKKAIKDVPALANVDLTDIFKLMDEAMDEMPSGALNGLTPNESKKLKKEAREIELNKEKRYVKQKNACLSEEDAKLFYKIYFALLEFTNKKYNVNSKLKIYNQVHLDPREVNPIINEFWEHKEEITVEFCLVNLFKFTKEELHLAGEFKKGFRQIITIAKYEEEYTAVLANERIYMIKGINDNIDKVISYKDLPYICMTSILPFKNVLIYDSVFSGYNISFGSDFEKLVEKELNSGMKYYHL